MLRLRKFLRALLRMRRSADFVFGINQDLIICSERVTVAERRPLSTATLWLLDLVLGLDAGGDGHTARGDFAAKSHSSTS